MMRDMLRMACLCLVALSACALPSPRFLGTPAREVVSDGMRFRVYRRADEVEVHRFGGGAFRREGEILIAALRAIEAATGCPVRPRSMEGDQAVIVAEIDCPPADAVRGASP